MLRVRISEVIRSTARMDDTSMPPQKKLKVSEPSADNSVNGKGSDPGTSMKDSPPESVLDGDWRPSNWVRRNHYALKNNLLCDVIFEVGAEEGKRRSFHAHRLILALASPVFEAMFYGQLAEKGDSVTITDIDPEGFEALLRYIYSDEVAVEGNINCLFQLWIAADKYCIPRIKIDCERHFASAVLSPSNVWSTLQAALFLDLKKVVERCHTYLSSNTAASLLSEDVTSINLETMQSFLSLNLLRTTELSLLSALIKWGEAQKEYSLRNAVEPCIKLIRFGALSASEFCQFLDMTKDVMSDVDALSILKHLTKPKSYPLPDWCTTKSWSRSPSYPDAASDDSDDSSSSDSGSTTDSSNSSSSNSDNHHRRRRHPAGDNNRSPYRGEWWNSSE